MTAHTFHLVPAEIRDLCRALLDGLQNTLGDVLHSLYIYGAAAFPDAENQMPGDIDFHVLLKRPLDAAEKGGVKALHDCLARDYPLLGKELDGYYILLADACRAAPPVHQVLPGISDNSWALHRAHILAGRAIVLYGPDPASVLTEPTWPELDEALQSELDFVRRHLAKYPAYCVLNLCRLIFSYTTQEVVVSKRTAAAWAMDAAPAYEDLVLAALKDYDDVATVQDRTLLETHVENFYQFALAAIQKQRAAFGS